MANTTAKPSNASLLKAADELLAANKPARKTPVRKTAAKSATKTATKSAAKSASPAKRATAKGAVRTATAAERKKAEEKLADLIVKPTARRPGRPAKSNPDADYDDGLDNDGDVEVIPDIKIPKGRGKRGKDAKDLIARGPVTPEEYEARRNRLKLLIKLGKDRGYLTYGEINDH